MNSENQPEMARLKPAHSSLQECSEALNANR